MKLEKEMIEWTINYIKENEKRPTLEELNKAGYSREEIRQRFTNLGGLIDEVVKKNQNLLLLKEDFTGEKNLKNLRSLSKRNKRFIITTAQSGAKVNPKFLNSINSYCEKMDAKLLIIPMGKWEDVSASLKGYTFVSEPTDLNNNISIVPTQLNPSSINPASSLSRIGNRSKSVIYGATKLSKEVVATPGKHPHLILTTGAITSQNYKKEGSNYFTKNEWLATNEHEFSAILVEIVDDTFFHQREIMADVDGSFVDMSPRGAFRYSSDGKVSKEDAVALSVGDWHSGETSQSAYKSFPEISKLSGAKMTFLHDVFSYGQISHHDNGKEITKALKAESGMLDFKKEIVTLADDLRMWQKFAKKVMIVESNHDKHLEQNIENGNFWSDFHNRRYYLELALEMMNGNDPLKIALERYGKFDFKNVEFVGPENQVILNSPLGTLNLSSHGHESGNGHKKAGPKSLLQSLGAAVTGHTHSPRILPGGGNGGLWVNGTSTCTEGEHVPPYAKGNVASSWLKTSTLVFQKGNGRFLRQQITVMNDGKWHLDQGKVKDVDDVLFDSLTTSKVGKKCA